MQRNFKAEQHCRVIAAYETAYPDPLTLRAGEEVSIGQNDTRRDIKTLSCCRLMNRLTYEST